MLEDWCPGTRVSISSPMESIPKPYPWNQKILQNNIPGPPFSGTTLLSDSSSKSLSIYDPQASPPPQFSVQTQFRTTRPLHSTVLDDTGTNSAGGMFFSVY